MYRFKMKVFAVSHWDSISNNFHNCYCERHKQLDIPDKL